VDRDAEELTPEQKRENAWRRAGWLQVWIGTTSNPAGRRTRYWVRQGSEGLRTVFRGGDQPPPVGSEPDFYVNGPRVFRDNGHPDGPSSVPFYVVRRTGVYPSEGFPTGSSSSKHFEVRNLHRHGVSTVIRPNPKARPDG
jgi:hypothetical protein